MANVYLPGQVALMKAQINLEGGAIKACLVETGCTFLETHATLAAVLAVGGGELDAASGYARQTLGTPVCAVASDKAKFSSSNVVFTNVDSADTAIGMVIYYDPGTGDANCIPLYYSDAADEVFTTGNTKTLTYICPTDGWSYSANA